MKYADALTYSVHVHYHSLDVLSRLLTAAPKTGRLLHRVVRCSVRLVVSPLHVVPVLRVLALLRIVGVLVLVLRPFLRVLGLIPFVSFSSPFVSPSSPFSRCSLLEDGVVLVVQAVPVGELPRRARGPRAHGVIHHVRGPLAVAVVPERFAATDHAQRGSLRSRTHDFTHPLLVLPPSSVVCLPPQSLFSRSLRCCFCRKNGGGVPSRGWTPGEGTLVSPRATRTLSRAGPLHYFPLSLSGPCLGVDLSSAPF